MGRHTGYSAKRQAILDAALRLLGDVGYDALTMDGVVRAAGVSKGTLYHYWTSKESLLQAAFDAVVDAAVVPPAEQTAEGDPRHRLDAALALVRPWRGPLAAEAPRLAALLKSTDGLAAVQARVHARLVDALAAVLEPILAEDDVAVPDPAATAALLASLAVSARAQVMARPGDAAAAARILGAFLLVAERAVGLPDGTLPREDEREIAEVWR